MARPNHDDRDIPKSINATSDYLEELSKKLEVMSFFGMGGRPQPSSAERIAAAEAEIELVSDMFNRLSASCMKKCVPADYREGDLNKGESVCLDRCVAKFFEVNMKVSEKMQSEAAGRGGMGGGFGSM